MNISGAFNMAQLAKLAQSKNPKKRDQLFLALGSLCAINPAGDKDPANGVVDEIMILLNTKASEETRQQASNILCDKSAAPRDLIMSWANDIIPIANPVLLKSPVLSEMDLIEIAQNNSLFHRLTIANRPKIGLGVTDVLVGFSEPEVLIAMTTNVTADLSMETFASCVRISRRHPDLRSSLSKREDLPRSLIPSLFAYSDDSERAHISEVFGVDLDNFSSVVRQAVMDKPTTDSTTASDTEEIQVSRLISKLAKSKSLNSGLVIKAANTEKFLFFEHALSTLAGVPVEIFRSAMHHGPSVALALSCQAASMDRSVFPALHRSLKDNGYITESLTGEIATKSAKAFSNHSPAAAAVALRLMNSNA